MPFLIALLLVVAVVIVAFAAVGVALKLLYYVIVGLVVGALARLLVPGRQAIGWLTTILYGLAGAFLGGIAADALGFEGIGSLVMSIASAALLVGVFEGSFGRRRA